MSRTFFSFFFFCIVLVVSVPKNTNLLGWYLTSRIGCLVEVLNCWTFNLYVYRYTDTYKYMYIYIYTYCMYICIYTLYTHSTHVPQRTYFFWLLSQHLQRIGAYSQCTSQNRSVSLVANLAAGSSRRPIFGPKVGSVSLKKNMWNHYFFEPYSMHLHTQTNIWTT